MKNSRTLRQTHTASIRMKQALSSAIIINCRADQRFDETKVEALTYEEFDSIPDITLVEGSQ